MFCIHVSKPAARLSAFLNASPSYLRDTGKVCYRNTLLGRSPSRYMYQVEFDDNAEVLSFCSTSKLLDLPGEHGWPSGLELTCMW
jgi:hypothetical protein